MKKTLLLLAAAVALAFGLITFAKRRASEGLGAGTALTGAEKQRIKTFWATFNQANAFRTRGDFASAAAAYRETLKLDPKHEDSLYYLGTSLEELGDYSGAVESFSRLLAANPASGRALGELGNTLATLTPGAPGDFAAARQAFLRNVDVNREQAGPFLRLGSLELNQGRFQAAAQDFRIAAAFGSPEGSFYLGYTLFLEQKYRDAIPYFRKVLDAYARDRKAAAKGVTQEGDIFPAPDKPLAPLAKAGLRSMLFLYWAAARLGGYPAGTPQEFQVHLAAAPKPLLLPAAEDLGLNLHGERATWADFEKNGHESLVIVGPNQSLRLYRQEGGNFRDATASARLNDINDIWDAYAVDYDGDGYPDLYLIRTGFLGAGQNLLYHNNRNGTFTDVTRAMGLQGRRATARACFADFDGNGRLDLVEVGAADADYSPLRFYRNTGKRFVEATQQAGLAASGTAVDCAVGDYDRDGKPDLFVLFWKRDAVLYRNLGNGKFTDATERAGLKGIGGESFSALFFDYDRDGAPDLLVTDHAPYEDVMQCLLRPGFKAARHTPRLFRNLGDGRFEEVTQSVGLSRAYGTMQAVAADIDGDGWPELIFANGSLDAQRLEPSVVLRNLRGKEFRLWSYLPGFTAPGNSIGVTVGHAGKHGVSIHLASNPLFRSGSNHGGLGVVPGTHRRLASRTFSLKSTR